MKESWLLHILILILVVWMSYMVYWINYFLRFSKINSVINWFKVIKSIYLKDFKLKYTFKMC